MITYIKFAEFLCEMKTGKTYRERERETDRQRKQISRVELEDKVLVETGSAKANGREPKTGLGRVFNYKLGCSDNVHVIMYTDAHPYL